MLSGDSKVVHAFMVRSVSQPQHDAQPWRLCVGCKHSENVEVETEQKLRDSNEILPKIW